MEITSDKRIINGYSEVGGIKIEYSISAKTSDRIDRITGSFVKDGVRVGNLSIERNGVLFMSIDKPGVVLSGEEGIAIAARFMQDAFGVFESQTSE